MFNVSKATNIFVSMFVHNLSISFHDTLKTFHCNVPLIKKIQIYITGGGGAGGNDMKYNVSTIESMFYVKIYWTTCSQVCCKIVWFILSLITS